MPVMPSAVSILRVTKLRPGQVTMTLAAVILSTKFFPTAVRPERRPGKVDFHFSVRPREQTKKTLSAPSGLVKKRRLAGMLALQPFAGAATVCRAATRLGRCCRPRGIGF